MAPRRRRTVALAQPVAALEQAVIGLIDNGKPGAASLLRGVEEGLHAAGCRSRSERKPHPAMPSPFIDELAGTCQAVVIAVGDGGAGTSWSVHDLIALEELGIPCVLVVLEDSREWALTEAASAGCPRPRLATVKGPLELVPADEVIARGRDVVPSVQRALTDAPG